jgi:hypothetical protein
VKHFALAVGEAHGFIEQVLALPRKQSIMSRDRAHYRYVLPCNAVRTTRTISDDAQVLSK